MIELNKHLAEKVVGSNVVDARYGKYYKGLCYVSKWNPSENIEQAFGCLETFEVWEISKLNPGYMILIDPYDDNDNWTKAIDNSLLMTIRLVCAKATGYDK